MRDTAQTTHDEPCMYLSQVTRVSEAQTNARRVLIEVEIESHFRRCRLGRLPELPSSLTMASVLTTKAPGGMGGTVPLPSSSLTCGAARFAAAARPSGDRAMHSAASSAVAKVPRLAVLPPPKSALRPSDARFFQRTEDELDASDERGAVPCACVVDEALGLAMALRCAVHVQVTLTL